MLQIIKGRDYKVIKFTSCNLEREKRKLRLYAANKEKGEKWSINPWPWRHLSQDLSRVFQRKTFKLSFFNQGRFKFLLSLESSLGYFLFKFQLRF